MSDGFNAPLTLPVDDAGLKAAISDLKRIEQLQARVQKKLASGPASRYSRAMVNYQNAALSGTPTQQFDAAHNVNQASRAYQNALTAMLPKQQRSQSAAMVQAMQKVFMSARVGVGGGGIQGMPLVGETIHALSAAGPFGMALAAAATALGTLSEAAKYGAANVTAFASAQYAGGGSTVETGIAKSLAGAAGLSAQDAAAGARSFGADLVNNPYAQATFARYGVQEFDPTGVLNPDRMTNYLRAIDALLNKMTQPEAQAAVNAAPELMPYMTLRNLPPAVRSRLMQDAIRDAQSFGPDAQRNAAYYNAQRGRLDAAMQRHVFQPAMHTFGKIAGFGTDILNGDWARVGRTLEDTFSNLVHNRPANQPGSAGYTPPAGSGDANRYPGGSMMGAGAMGGISPLDSNTRAMNRLTDAVLTMHREIVGGGPRTAGAVPAAWRGRALEEAQSSGLSRKLGVFVQ